MTEKHLTGPKGFTGWRDTHARVTGEAVAVLQAICVDSRICSIGTANIDIRRFSINYETNLVIYDEGVTRELEADFPKTSSTACPSTAPHTGRTAHRAG